MTMRLDIVTNDAGELVRREHARELGAGVVVAIYRLAKLAQMHDLGNQAFLRQLDQTHQMIGEYCLRSGSHVNILFAHKAVFVAGQLLKGSRATYDAASELGDMLEKFGGSELTIQKDVTREDVHAFAEQISLVFRTANAPFRPPPKIRLRPVNDTARLRGIELENLSPDKRIVRTYASAVVILRRFFEDLQASRYILPRRIKRVAQSLVDLSEGSTPAFLGVTEVRNANFDEAGRAVNSAILAVSMARETTGDRAVLSQIAMAAMMHDVARPRALALASASGPSIPGMAGPTTLSEDQEDRLAAGTAAVLTALGRLNEPSITRTVLTFEALWQRRQTWLGPVYWGARPSTLHATLIAVARRYNDLLTPEPGLPPPKPDFAVATLSDELKETQDRVALRMLVSALGLLPMGTVVQLNTGEVAEVVRGATGASDKPCVRIVVDANGAPSAQQKDVELAQDPRRSVVRVLSVDGWRKGLALKPQSDIEGGYTSDPPPPPEPAQPPPAAQTSGGGSAPYEQRFASWSSAPQAPAAPERESASLAATEPNSSGSLPSLGSSPSAVAAAMGRVISESMPPPSMSAQESDRTLFTPGPDLAERPSNKPLRASREPTARGNLASTPMPHVLVYMLDHGLTGSVMFEGARSEDAIFFIEGVPAKVRLGEPVALLGQVLVQAGVLAPKVVSDSVEGATRLGILFGEFLSGNDLVTREMVAWALEAQVLHRIAHIANLPPEISYAYYRDADLLEGWGGGDKTVSVPLNPILASVRGWTDRARVRATLNKIGKHPLVLHEEAQVEGLALTPEEKSVLDAIRTEPMNLATLLSRNVAHEEVVASLVYAFAVTRQFAFKGQKKGPMTGRGAPPLSPTGARALAASIPPMASAASVPVAPPSAPPAPAPAAGQTPRGSAARPNGPQIRPIAKKPDAASSTARAAAAPAVSQRRDTPDDDARTIALPAKVAQNLIAQGPPGAARAAFGGSAASAAAAPAPVAPAKAPSIPADAEGESVVFEWDAQPAAPPASPAGGDRDARPDAPAAIEIGAAGMEDAELALEAMSNFRLAEQALSRDDKETAQRLAQKAVDVDPSQPDYVSLLAWIRALGGNPSAMADAIQTMSRILKEEPSNERALLYRGRLYVRTNRFREALRDFHELLSANPQNKEASSELRLLKQRHGVS